MRMSKINVWLRLIGLALGFGGFVWMIAYCLSWQNGIYEYERGYGIHNVLFFNAIPLLIGILIAGFKPVAGSIILTVEGFIGIIFSIFVFPNTWDEKLQAIQLTQTIIFIVFSLITAGIFLGAHLFRHKYIDDAVV